MARRKEIKDAERCVLFIPGESKKSQAPHVIIDISERYDSSLLGVVVDKVYDGAVVLAVGCYGNDPLNPTLLDARLGNADADVDLSAAYWFLGQFRAYLCEAELNFESGKVYVWRGTLKALCEVAKEDEGTEHEYESRYYSLEWKGSLEELGNFNLDAE